MNWELIISILALVTGGGCFVWIFNAGHWKGEVTARMESFRNDLDRQRETLLGKVESNIDHNTDKLNANVIQSIDAAASALRTDFESKIVRVHQRFDDESKLSETKVLQGRLDSLLSGMQSQRQEWDQLRSDVRTLLRAEATTSTEIANFKERLYTFEQKVGALSEKTTRLESDMNHVTTDRKR